MLTKLHTIYLHSRHAKLTVCLVLAGAGYLLFKLDGGFPTWAWRFLFSILGRLSTLWETHGASIIIPLVGLLLLSYSLLILWGIIVIGISQSIVLLWHDFRLYDDTQSDYNEEARLTEPQDINSAHNQSGVQHQSDIYENQNMSSLTPQPSQSAMEELHLLARRKTRDHPGNIPSRPRIPSVASQNEKVVHEISAAFKEANLPIDEQKTRLIHLRSSQTPIDQYTLPLRGAVPDYEPLPTRSNVQQTRTSSLYGHLRLIPEQATPEQATQEHNFAEHKQLSEDEEQIDIDLFETRPITEEEEQIDIDLFETRPITEEEDDNSILPFDINREDHLTDEPEEEATFRFVVGLGLDPGLTRKHRPNEDSVFALQGIRTTSQGPVPTGLFVVADGMGGHANGREASRMAVREISNIIVPTLLNDDAGEVGETDESQEALLNMLKDGVQRANLAIYERNREMPTMMGTTITATLIVNTTAYVVNIGDSRTYLYRPGMGLIQITRDHSVVARFVEHGIIKPEEIYTHPQRNQIYRCLGEHSTVDIDTFIAPLEPDDVLLLCSDGLWEMVRDPMIEKIISTSAHQPSQTSNLLVEAAIQHGGADNISVIVVSIVKTTD